MKSLLLAVVAYTSMMSMAVAQTGGAAPPADRRETDGNMSGMDHQNMKMTDGEMASRDKPMFNMVVHAMDIQMMMPSKEDAPSTVGYKTALMTMMHDMPLFTGKLDADFMRQMRVHHQAAIDMAKVVLANSQDAQVTRLANQIVAAQTKEIGVIDAWLRKTGL